MKWLLADRRDRFPEGKGIGFIFRELPGHLDFNGSENQTGPGDAFHAFLIGSHYLLIESPPMSLPHPFWFLLALSAAIASLACAATARPPNIVFILADDLTAQDLPAYGGVNVATPNLDRLAAEGLTFERCFQATAMCSPTRHNLYTGLDPVRSGAYPQATWVYPGVQSIVHYLRPLGYRVALNGKRHILPEKSFPFDYLDDDTEPDLALVEDYLTAAPDQPTALFLCYRDPHTPWTKGDRSGFAPDKLILPPNFVDTPETRRQLVNYYAEIGWLDEAVGGVMALIDRLGMRDNTLLIFAGEQGSAFPFAKWTCYERGLQSALIARWPGVIAPGTRTPAMVEYVDMVPTLVSAAGGTPPPNLDGRSFLPVMRDGIHHHKDVVFGMQTTRGITNGSEHYGIRTVRNDRYRYIVNLTAEAAFRNNVTNQKGSWSKFWGTWKTAASADAHARRIVDHYQHRPAEELYDIEADPFELHNLADDPAHEEIKADLRVRLQAWMDRQGDRGAATEAIADQRCLKSTAGLEAALLHPDFSTEERSAIQAVIRKRAN